MEVLGRNANIIPLAKSQSFKMRGASSAMITCSIPSVGSGDTFTVNEASSFAGGLTAITVIKNIYWATAANGTVAWQKITYSQTNLTGIFLTAGGPLSAITLGTAGTTGLTTALVAVFHVFTSELSDPNNYIQCTVTGSNGLVNVVLSDLVVQRAPANLEILAS